MLLRKVKGVISNITGSGVLLFVGLILLAYLSYTVVLSKERIYKDSLIRSTTHKELLKKSSWDYLSSILWIEYNHKDRENKIVTSEINSRISEMYPTDEKLKVDFDLALAGKTSNVTDIVRKVILPFGDKIVLMRHGDKLMYIDDVTGGGELKLVDKDNNPTDIAKSILRNTSPTFENFNKYIYNIEGSGSNVIDIEKIKTEFLDGSYDVGTLKGSLICASYIDWKRGIFGDNIILPGDKLNPEVRQLIVLSKIDIVNTINNNPSVLTHLSNFSRNAKVVDATFNANDRYNLFILVGNLFMILLVGFTIMIQYDLINIRKEHKRRRRYDDIFKSEE